MLCYSYKQLQRIGIAQCSGQNLTPSKMTTRPSPFNPPRYIRTLLRSPRCSRPTPDLLRSKAYPIPKTSAPSQVAPATGHPRSLPTVTPTYFSPRS